MLFFLPVAETTGSKGYCATPYLSTTEAFANSVRSVLIMKLTQKITAYIIQNNQISLNVVKHDSHKTSHKLFIVLIVYSYSYNN